MSEFRVGSRYTYCTKEQCIEVANQAKKQGFDVKYGVTPYIGTYYFEIVDPFKEAEG